MDEKAAVDLDLTGQVALVTITQGDNLIAVPWAVWQALVHQVSYMMVDLTARFPVSHSLVMDVLHPPTAEAPPGRQVGRRP